MENNGNRNMDKDEIEEREQDRRTKRRKRRKSSFSYDIYENCCQDSEKTEKSSRAKKWNVLNFSSLAIVILICSFGFVEPSRIVFENGVYHNITVALNDDAINPENCTHLIQSIQNTFQQASNYLYKSSGGKASFGTIRILIPRNFDSLHCNSSRAQVIAAEKGDNYDSADLKISAGHPFALNLPWVDQLSMCGISGASIFIPPSFYSTLSLEESARIFLHDWILFRYGVFPEYGFLDDPLYSPCYKKNNQIFFAGCTLPLMDSVVELDTPNSGSLSPSDCKKIILDNLDKIRNHLSSVTSSILFAPHLSNSTTQPCSNVTHNWLPNTKQNVHCSRLSAAEVIMNHRDFAQIPENQQFPKGNVEVEIVQHSTATQLQGYAFVIENSDNIRQFSRLRHVKQSIAEFIRLVNTSSRSMVASLTYNGEFHVLPQIPMELSEDSFKSRFLNRIPDMETAPITSVFTPLNSRGKGAAVKTKPNKSLQQVFDILKKNVLDTQPTLKWNVILVTSVPPLDLPSTLGILSTTDHAVSVVTFDDSPEWLQWNSIPQTRKLLYLPVCSDSLSVCSSKTSSILTDHLLEILSDQQPIKRYFHKAVELELRGTETSGTFEIPNSSGNSIPNFFISLSRYSNETFAVFTPPSQVSCASRPLLDCPFTLTLDDSSPSCGYQAGTWRVTVSGIPPNTNVSHVLRVFIESVDSTQDLSIEPSFPTHDLTKELTSPTQNPLVPIHISVRNKADQPIINAKVQAEIIHSLKKNNNAGIVTKFLDLLDDGVEPDGTKNDGIYSTFLRGFSSEPSFHSGTVRISTDFSSFSINSILPDSNRAALFDPTASSSLPANNVEKIMQSKCCGSFIPIGGTEYVGRANYSITLPSFRTGGFITNPEEFPPSRINVIQISEETEERISLKFTTPRSNSESKGGPHHYDVCRFGDCKGEECLCQSLSTSSASTVILTSPVTSPEQEGEGGKMNQCEPVSPGSEQNCIIDKNFIIENLLLDSEKNLTEISGGNGKSNESIIVTVTCGIRAVNPGNISGEISATLFQTSLTLAVGEGAGAAVRECKNVSDGCLPIDIFWILIGILSALVLILLILLILCCCRYWRNRKKQNNPGGPSQSKSKGKDVRPFDNDDFNSRGLYKTSIRKRDSSPEMQQPSFRKPSYKNRIRQRSISGEAGRNNSHHGNTKTQTNTGHDSVDEMPVFFSKRPVSSPPGQIESLNLGLTLGQGQGQGQNHSSREQERPLPSSFRNKSSNHSQRQDKINSQVPIPPHSYDDYYLGENSRQTHLTNPTRHIPNNNNNSDVVIVSNKTSMGKTTIPSISSTVDMQMSNDSLNFNGNTGNREYPVYASVNRNGLRNPNQNKSADRNSIHSTFTPSNPQRYSNTNPGQNYYNDSYLHPSQQNTGVNHQGNKNQQFVGSAQSLDSGFIRNSPDSSNFLLPPTSRQQQFRQPHQHQHQQQIPVMRMDRFPSSESETYSEMSTVPPPPPLPDLNTLKIQRRNPNPNNNNIAEDERGKNPPSQTQTQTRSPTPPENGFGILAKMGNIIPDRNSLRPPRTVPPPPPRKTMNINTNSNTTATTANHNYIQNQPNVPANKTSKLVSGYENRSGNKVPPVVLPPPPASSAQDDTDREDISNNMDFDDDSDTWDVYDDFEFNPGVSHV